MRSKSGWTVALVVVTAGGIAGCAGPAASDEPVGASETYLVDGFGEAAGQASAVQTAVTTASSVEDDFRLSRRVFSVGREAIASATEDDGPAAASEAAHAVRRALVRDGALVDAAAAIRQFLTSDPSDSTGPIGSGGIGCFTVSGFWLRGGISEPDPPFARLELTFDSSMGIGCQKDGLIRYDMRNDPSDPGLESLRLNVSYPDGFTVHGDPDRVIAAGSNLTFGMQVARLPLRITGIDVAADYCVSDGADGDATCLSDVSLAIRVSVRRSTPGEGISSLLERLRSNFSGGAVLQTTLAGNITWGGTRSMSFGDVGLRPFSFRAGWDATTGLFAYVDGGATVTDGTETASFDFASLAGASSVGLGFVSPPGEASVEIDGCSSLIVPGTESSFCYEGFTLATSAGAGPETARLSVNGSVTRTLDGASARLVYEATSIDLGASAAVFDGSITRTADDGTLRAAFEAFTLEWSDGFTFSGVVDVEASGTNLRADFCDGSALVIDGATETATVSGCFVWASRLGVLTVGSVEDPVELRLSRTQTYIDATATFDDEEGDNVFAVDFDGWTSENLDPSVSIAESAHRRFTGRAAVTVAGFEGSVESTEGLETQLSGDAETGTLTVTLDGDVDVSLSRSGGTTLAGTVGFAGFSAALTGQEVGLMGNIDLSLPGTEVLPVDELRVIFGDGTRPMTASLADITTTLDGTGQIGVGCESGVCSTLVTAELTALAFDWPACGRQSPHAGTAELSGLNPAVDALLPPLQVSCDCNGGGGTDLMLPATITMQFSDATPTAGLIDVPAATGTCVSGLRIRTDASCDGPGTSTLSEPSVCTEVPPADGM